MKKIYVLTSLTLLFLTSCANFGDGEMEILQQEDENEGETVMVPGHSLSEDEYKITLPFRPSAARGVIDGQMKNRFDINEIEVGLRRHATTLFDPEDYFFEEGQYLTRLDVLTLIDDLNPERDENMDIDEKREDHKKNPRVFSHLLEQNFLKKAADDTVELAGVAIGIALKSEYQFQVEVGSTDEFVNISDDTILEEGKKIANEVVHILRDKEALQNIPILITLYKEQSAASPIPGNFMTKTVVEEDMVAVGKWEDIDEENVLFPSSYAAKHFSEDNERFTKFGDKISTYFPNYVSIIGKGFYIDETLRQIMIEIPLEFQGQSEIVGFTQYAYGLVQEIFKNQYDIEVRITSSNRTEALIFLEAGETEPFVHIYH